MVICVEIYSPQNCLQSFANIAKTSTEQLQTLPGFGQVKAKRIQDAFSRPFRTKATTTVSLTSQSEQFAAISGQSNQEAQPSNNASEAKSAGKQRRREREPSPVWDIELDLNESPSPTSETGPLPQHSPPLPISGSVVPENGKRKRPPSPVWDIELDLNENEAEEEEAVARKRLKDGFGVSSLP